MPRFILITNSRFWFWIVVFDAWWFFLAHAPATAELPSWKQGLFALFATGLIYSLTRKKT